MLWRGFLVGEEFAQGRLRLLAFRIQLSPCEKARFLVRRLEGGDRACDATDIGDGPVVFRRRFRRDTKNSAALEVAHAVAADAGVIPVGDDQRAIRRDADVARAEPAIVAAFEDVENLGGVASAVGLGEIGAHNVRPGVAVDQLAVEDFGQEVALVNADAGRRASAGLQQVGHDTGIVEVPVPVRDLLLDVRPRGGPTGAGDLVLEAVVAELHDVVDAHAFVTVVVVVALPDRAERIDRELPVVAEVPAKRLDVGAVELTAEHHAILVGGVAAAHLVAGLVDDDLAVFVVERSAGVAEIEIQPPVGAEVEGVDAVVVLRAPDLGEHQLLAARIRFAVAVFVVKAEDVVAGGDDDAVAEHADAVHRIDVHSLVENRGFVGFGITVGVFEYQNAVALGALALVAPVVDDLADPDAPLVVDVDGTRAEHHRLAGEELRIEILVNAEAGDRVGGITLCGKSGNC